MHTTRQGLKLYCLAEKFTEARNKPGDTSSCKKSMVWAHGTVSYPRRFIISALSLGNMLSTLQCKGLSFSPEIIDPQLHLLYLCMLRASILTFEVLCPLQNSSHLIT